MAQQTPLYEQHTLCGARMVDFHGWMMPLHYGSQIDEHHAVRTDAGMFDVSHMTIVDLRGSRTREFLRYLLANDVAKLTKSGKALYSGMLNVAGIYRYAYSCRGIRFTDGGETPVTITLNKEYGTHSWIFVRLKN